MDNCKINDDIYIASFDIGKINFAYCIEKTSIADLQSSTSVDDMCLKGSLISIDNVRLVSYPKKSPVIRQRGPRKGTSYKPSGRYTFDLLFTFLEERKEQWNRCHIFVIEQQMNQNKEGQKISYHLEAYFKTIYGLFKEVLLFPSYHKTQVFQDPEEKYKKISYSKRKKACIDKATNILQSRDDQTTICKLERSKKRDDMCDVICQLQAYKWLKLASKMK
ncbi:RuvC-like Holliday junction resolvase [Armadillidium vulgare iridescent virus]|uniref:RuvC-like Holliday junction resolvase n=1 Tax=Armadillidium vulgare iridescent virus TaxID=72201 RepID=A0A068QL42_9VIRU|nr:RuvC-like Holliday junction resolvase [Armadillidium vulgare iridescent virus]CCV02460.1 RuvC-like Holliday junction resolvase [Armadillidium vulgare iridescent virus]